MKDRVPRADWAATVPWSGIIGKPPGVGEAVDLSAVRWAGVPANRYPVWNGAMFVPTQLPSSSGGGSGGTTIASGMEPGIATRRRPAGQPSSAFINIWDRSVFDVRLYGATGDGGTDDSEAINSAIYALEAAGGGTLYFPAGNYVAPTIQEINAPARVRGDGIGVTNFDVNGGVCFSFAGTSTWFAVDNLSVSDASIAFDVQSGSILARDVAATVSQYAFRLGELSRVEAGLIDGAFLYSAGTSVAIYGDANMLEIANLHALGTTGQWERAIDITAGEELFIHDCYVANTAQNAIRLQASVQDTRIHNVTCKDVLGSELVADLGANNYVNELFGIGGNTDTRFEDRKELVAYFDWAPGVIAAGFGFYEDLAMNGVSIGDQCIAGTEFDLEPSVCVQVHPKASDVARLIVMNFGTASINLTSAQWRVRAFN